MRRAVLLDRDGVLNEDKGYVYKKEDITWLAGATSLIGELTRKGYIVLVVTNQSGVARGMYTEEDVRQLHTWMNKEFAKQGGRVEAFYYCPHLRNAKIKKYDEDCVCRKPRPGMIIQALSQYRIERDNAVLFGDSERDIAAAKRAGIDGYLFEGGNIRDFVMEVLKDRGWEQ